MCPSKDCCPSPPLARGWASHSGLERIALREQETYQEVLGGNHGAGGNANGGGEGAQLSSCPQPHAVLSPCLLVSLTRVLVSLTRVVGLMKTGIQWPLLMTSFVTSCLVVRPFPAHLSLSDFSTSAPPPPPSSPSANHLPCSLQPCPNLCHFLSHPTLPLQRTPQPTSPASPGPQGLQSFHTRPLGSASVPQTRASLLLAKPQPGPELPLPRTLPC